MEKMIFAADALAGQICLVTGAKECGPGKVLTGLVKRIAPEIRLHGISSEATLEATLEALAA